MDISQWPIVCNSQLTLVDNIKWVKVDIIPLISVDSSSGHKLVTPSGYKSVDIMKVLVVDIIQPTNRFGIILYHPSLPPKAYKTNKNIKFDNLVNLVGGESVIN